MPDDFLSATELAELEQREQREKRCAGGRKKKNGTGYRSRKVECRKCGFGARTTIGALERSGGAPFCGCGTGRLELVKFEDRIAAGDADAIEHDEREHEEREARAMMRNARGGAADPKRCAVPQCFRFCRARFCDEHAAETWRIAS